MSKSTDKVHCPECGWKGTLMQTAVDYIVDKDNDERRADVCPKCDTEVEPGHPTKGKKNKYHDA